MTSKWHETTIKESPIDIRGIRMNIKQTQICRTEFVANTIWEMSRTQRNPLKTRVWGINYLKNESFVEK